MKEKRKTRSELKREAIVDAAKRAFQEHGVQGTSMDLLADLAQVSKRTVYNHFSSKEELVLHLLSDLWTQSMVQADIPYQSDKPLEDQLSHLIEAEIELVSGSEFLGLARAAAGFYMYQPEKLEALIAEFQLQQTALHRWIGAAVDDGRLVSLDVDFAVEQLHNLVKGSCYWPQLLGYADVLNADDKQRLAVETVRMFLSRYAAN